MTDNLNDAATANSLVEIFMSIEEKESQLTMDLEEAKKNAEAKTHAVLLGNGAPKPAKEARDAVRDLSSQLESCDALKTQIILRLQEVLPGELLAEADVLSAEYDQLKQEEEVLLKRCIQAIAQASVLLEKLSGIHGSPIHQGFLSVSGYINNYGRSSELYEAIKSLRIEHPEDSIADQKAKLHRKETGFRELAAKPGKAVHELLKMAGARDYQHGKHPKEDPMNAPLSECVLSETRTEIHPVSAGKVTAAEYMGYKEISPPKTEFHQIPTRSYEH